MNYMFWHCSIFPEIQKSILRFFSRSARNPAIVSPQVIIFIFFIGVLRPPDSICQILKQSRYFAQLKTSGLLSNNISEILFQNTNVWLGTGRGLNMTPDEGMSFVDFFEAPGVGKGGVSALAVGNGIIWVATAFDTTILDESESAGGGLSWSNDNGITWNHFAQPVDPNTPEELGYKPTTTNVQNVTFDIALEGNTIWISSWGGGLRKSDDSGITWTVVTPDEFPFDALGNLNHRPFSVISAANGIWVGTAQGINKSTDGGLTWTNYTAQNGSGISGNFVTALAEQVTVEGSIIWAATWKAEDENEFFGISRTMNNGLTWDTMLEGEFSHNIGFNGDEVFVATDNGLFKSPDRGETWGIFPLIDDGKGLKVLTTVYFDVKIRNDKIWLGTADGLVTSETGGSSWDIFRAFVTPGIDDEPDAYAYPNPFSPLRHNRIGDRGVVRIQYSISQAADVTIDIFDYGMNLVKNVVSNVSRPSAGSYAETWDGTNNWGVTVANGVYFFRLRRKGHETFWGKIIVIN